MCTANQIALAKHLTGATAVNWGAMCNSTFIMHGDQILLVLVITVSGVCVYNTHACPNDTTTYHQASGGDTQTEFVASREDISTEPTSSSGEGILTEIVSSGDVMPTEPVSSGEPPTNRSKTCTCRDGVTKLKIRRMKARIISGALRTGSSCFARAA